MKHRMLEKKISKKLKSQGFLKDEEIRLKRKDGSIITCSFSASAVRDENGKVIHYDGIIEDISERIKEEELAKSCSRLQGILQNH